MSAQIAADLRAAADLLERDGWTQGVYHGRGGCHCAVGAMAVAVSGAKKPNPDFWDKVGWRARRTDAARVFVQRVIRSPHLQSWNDQPERTAAEVIATLRAAADRAEAES